MKLLVGVQKRIYGSVVVDVPDEELDCSIRAQKTRVQKAAIEAIKNGAKIIKWDETIDDDLCVDFGFMKMDWEE